MKKNLKTRKQNKKHETKKARKNRCTRHSRTLRYVKNANEKTFDMPSSFEEAHKLGML